MKTRNLKQTLAPAVLLLAAALGMAGCSQSEDTPVVMGTTARGGEPIHISVRPKPGFAPDAPGTRAAVADGGTFAWEEGSNADKIFFLITFNDAASTRRAERWYYAPGDISNPGLTDWYMRQGWTADDSGAAVATPYTWPVGASSATVQAFYTDCEVTGVDVSGGDNAPLSLTFGYTGGTGDHMLYTKTIAPGEDISIDFKHITTRLVFKGLAASTAYSLFAEGALMTYPTTLTREGFTLGNAIGQTFTSDADGKLVICASLDDKIDAAGKVTLELRAAGGTSAGTAELTAKGTSGAYKMDGYMYTLSVMSNSGGSVGPDGYPDLLLPAPIAPGNTVYAVNGYYVTAPDADEKKEYQWASSGTATAMTSDPCAGHGNWRMPTMEDFEKMAGWTATWPWSQAVGTAAKEILSDKDAWNAAFPSGSYWSSVARTSDSNAWRMYSLGAGKALYNSYTKTTSYPVRCVIEK